jgi:hypothetical protein
MRIATAALTFVLAAFCPVSALEPSITDDPPQFLPASTSVGGANTHAPLRADCDPYSPPPGTLPEGEPSCHDGYVDETNGGCSSDAEVFAPISINTILLGTSGNYNGNTAMDEDWFEVTLTELEEIVFCVCAEFPVSLRLLTPFFPNFPCLELFQLASEEGSAFTTTCIFTTLNPGIYWFVVAPDGMVGAPCDQSEYLMLVGEGTGSGIEDELPGVEYTWGAIKGIYR